MSTNLSETSSPKNIMEPESGKQIQGNYQRPCIGAYNPSQMPKTISFRKDHSVDLYHSPPLLPTFDREGECHHPHMAHHHMPPQPVPSSAPIAGYHPHCHPPGPPPPPAYYGYPPYGYPSYQWAPPVSYVSVEYITELHPHDVLSGRGGATNSYRGNRAFRELVKEYQEEYLKAKKRDKPSVASVIVELVRRRGGRFLRRCNEQQGDLVWVDIGDDRAREKTCQALREGAPEIRRKYNRKGDVCHSPTTTTTKSEIQGTLSLAHSEDDSAARSSSLHQHPTPHKDEPIRIRPWDRLLPKRGPVAPIELDQLPANQREMYLRDFMPPTWSSGNSAVSNPSFQDMVYGQ